MSRARSIAVVGGGFAGLAAALPLVRAGVEVRVYRTHAGRVQTRAPSPDLPGWRIETGAPSVTHRAEAVFSFAEQVGIGRPGSAGSRWRPMAPLARDRYVADGDKLKPVGVATLGLRQAAEFARGMVRHRAPGDDETIAEWARLQFGHAIASGLARALTIGVWGCAPEHVGFADAWPDLHKGLQGASPMALQARLASAPAALDAVSTGTWSIEGGMGTLGELALQAFLGAGGRLVEGPVTDLDAIDADAVVLATDATDAASVTSDPGIRALLAAIDHSPMAVVHWLAEPQDRPRGFGFLVPPPDPVLGTLFMSDLRDEPNQPWAPPGLRAFTTMTGGLANPGWLERTDSELVADVVNRHARWFGAAPVVVAAHVVRWPRAVSIPAPGHRARVARILAAGRLSARPVHYAGAWVAGGTLDDAVCSGQAAASHVLAGEA